MTHRAGTTLPVGRSREPGFALLGCLLLLGIVSVLGSATLAGSIVDLRRSLNVIHRDRAFHAAEYAIVEALTATALATGWTLQAPRRVPDAEGERMEIPGADGDSFRYLVYFVDAVPDETGLPAGVAAFHFIVEATGYSGRGATDTHVQGFHVLRPAGWTSDAVEPTCDPAAADCEVPPPAGPTRTHWRQAQAE